MITYLLLTLITLSAFKKKDDDRNAILYFSIACWIMLFICTIIPVEVIRRHFLICGIMNLLIVLKLNTYEKSSLIMSIVNITLAFVWLNLFGLLLMALKISPLYFNIVCNILYISVLAVIHNKWGCNQLGNFRIHWFDNFFNSSDRRSALQLQVFPKKTRN